MASFLRNNQPWAQLTERGNIEIRELNVDATGSSDELPVRLTPSLSFKPVPVPHRAELSDTVAYVVSVRGRGDPSSVATASTKLGVPIPDGISSCDKTKTMRFLYCPDTDCWSDWTRSIGDWCSEVDVALLDATFYSKDELKGRDMSEVGGPLSYGHSQ